MWTAEGKYALEDKIKNNKMPAFRSKMANKKFFINIVKPVLTTTPE
jgi:hypothetical protein